MQINTVATLLTNDICSTLTSSHAVEQVLSIGISTSFLIEVHDLLLGLHICNANVILLLETKLLWTLSYVGGVLSSMKGFGMCWHLLLTSLLFI